MCMCGYIVINPTGNYYMNGMALDRTLQVYTKPVRYRLHFTTFY